MLEAAENELLCAGRLREGVPGEGGVGGGVTGVPPPPCLLVASGVNPKLPGARWTSDVSWAWSVGQAGWTCTRASVCPKGPPAVLRGHLGIRGQSSWPWGSLVTASARTAGQILYFRKDGNKKWKSGLRLQDLDFKEQATVERALLQAGRCPHHLPRAPRVGCFS